MIDTLMKVALEEVLWAAQQQISHPIEGYCLVIHRQLLLILSLNHKTAGDKHKNAL